MPKPLTVWITINCGKFKGDRNTILRNLYAGQEATVRTGHLTTDWFQIWKRVRQGFILSPCLFNLYAEYIKRNAGLEEAPAGIKIAWRNIHNLRYADDTTLMAESEEKLKSLLMKVKEEEWKSWLKTQHSENEDHGIWSHHFMANRWGNSGDSDRLYFLGLQNQWRWWLQLWNSKMLAPWKKTYDQPKQHIQKQRHYFANKGPPSQSYGFSNRCECWTIKKAEHWRIDAFELWRWRKLLRVPWTTRRSSKSILKEISAE